jgi:hypothetical protein
MARKSIVYSSSKTSTTWASNSVPWGRIKNRRIVEYVRDIWTFSPSQYTPFHQVYRHVSKTRLLKSHVADWKDSPCRSDRDSHIYDRFSWLSFRIEPERVLNWLNQLCTQSCFWIDGYMVADRTPTWICKSWPSRLLLRKTLSIVRHHCKCYQLSQSGIEQGTMRGESIRFRTRQNAGSLPPFGDGEV